MIVTSRWTNFYVNNISEVYFWKSQWENFDPNDLSIRVSLYYFVYRLLYMLWLVGSYIAFFVCGNDEDYLFYVYLTNQTYTLQVLYSVLYFAYICWKIRGEHINVVPNPGASQISVTNPEASQITVVTNTEASQITVVSNPEASQITVVSNPEASKITIVPANNRLPCSATVLWLMMNIVYVNPYPVSIVYWLLLEDKKADMQTPCKTMRNHLVHTVNSPTAFIDSLVVSVPMRFSHIIFPVLGACTYCLFALVYELAHAPLETGRVAIYRVLDWNNDPTIASITSAGGIAAGFFGHIVFCWGMFNFRVYVTKILKIGPQYIASLLHEHANAVNDREKSDISEFEVRSLETSETSELEIKGAGESNSTTAESARRERQSTLKISRNSSVYARKKKTSSVMVQFHKRKR